MCQVLLIMACGSAEVCSQQTPALEETLQAVSVLHDSQARVPRLASPRLLRAPTPPLRHLPPYSPCRSCTGTGLTPLPLLAAGHVHYTGKDSPALVQIVSCLWFDAALLYTKGAFLHSLTPLGSSMYWRAQSASPQPQGAARCVLAACAFVRRTLLAACGTLRAACCTRDVGMRLHARPHTARRQGGCSDYRKMRVPELMQHRAATGCAVQRHRCCPP